MAAHPRDVWPLLKNLTNEYKLFESGREALTEEDIECARRRGVRANVIILVLDGNLDCGEPRCRGRCHLKDPTRSKIDSACPNCDRTALFGVIGDGRPVKKSDIRGAPENAKRPAEDAPAPAEALKQASIGAVSEAIIARTAEMKRMQMVQAVKKQVQADKLKTLIPAEERLEEEESKKASTAKLSEACIRAKAEVERVLEASRVAKVQREYSIKYQIAKEKERLDAKYGMRRIGPKGKYCRQLGDNLDKFQDDSDSDSEGGSSGYYSD
jgi:hypothetical protein